MASDALKSSSENGYVEKCCPALDIRGVKRLATQIRKERGVKHSKALELAAQAAKCANFRHAHRILPAQNRAFGGHTLFLTVYWYDKTSRQCGRETLKIQLSKPILDLCSKSDLKLVRGLRAMRMAAVDHFVSDKLAQSQDYANDVIRQAQGTLRFIEHTGLRPSRDYRASYPAGSRDNQLPGTDHPTYWVDPANGQFILIDEPYKNVPIAADRAAWAQQHGWSLRKSSWPGMYYPHKCDLFIATNGTGSYDLDALVAKIDVIPDPLFDEGLAQETAPFLDVFISPMAKTPQDRRRARSKATIMPRPSNTTIPYSANFGNFGRRPAGAIPVAGHIEMGRIIKSVLDSLHTPDSVGFRMNTLRARLEDWLTFEIGRSQLTGPEFFSIYYRDPDSEGPYAEAAQSRPGLIRILGELKQKLQTAYPSCGPLREQLQLIDMSISHLGKMKATAGET